MFPKPENFTGLLKKRCSPLKRDKKKHTQTHTLSHTHTHTHTRTHTHKHTNRLSFLQTVLSHSGGLGDPALCLCVPSPVNMKVIDETAQH